MRPSFSFSIKKVEDRKEKQEAVVTAFEKTEYIYSQFALFTRISMKLNACFVSRSHVFGCWGPFTSTVHIKGYNWYLFFT